MFKNKNIDLKLGNLLPNYTHIMEDYLKSSQLNC